MNKKYLLYLSPLIFLIAFLIDGQLSTLITNWLPGAMTVSSHILFILSIFYSVDMTLRGQLIIMTALGALYDIYYLNVLGIGLTILPLMVYLIYYFYQQLKFNVLSNITILLVVLFGFEFGSFLLGRLFHLTNLSMYMFVFYNLAPTLLFNCLTLVALQPFFKKIFGITNKT
ncbi:rod shape-determining protein MreD [Streptococcus gallinaceus]|uniref:Rod shape-determining protein MreD n=1 Tax=Streptococcus gallinaceus TaxID=165758 RepID=A0ABV2JN42_9STRE|nr:rod shape-determining protein MreD [Streptococcus gallinaceus]MCP1640370.1 rod shape-determining protein MreD [Streptococcus gallinaceus]MCP1771153.1 rod shape-determining protein MreD [Streptococcus gallinaceus]